MFDNFVLFGVEFNFFDLLMTILLVACGAYCIYTAVRVRREYAFFENKILLPGNCKAEDCTDPDGFFDYIFSRLLIFGAGMILCALLDFGTLYLVHSGRIVSWLYWVQLLVPFAFFGWYIFVQRKASKLFW